MEEKYSALAKTEDKEEEIEEVDFSQKEKDLMSVVVDQIRRCSVASIPDDVGRMSSINVNKE